MYGDAVHQAGSEHMAMPYLSHPQSTVNMGWDKGSVLLLVQREEIGSNILPRLEQRVPAIEHSGDSPMPGVVG